MPDIKTALQNALANKVVQSTINAWDAHEDQIRKPKPQQENQVANPNPVVNIGEGQRVFGTSNNVMRATFEAVKNAPKMQIREYIEMLGLNGYKQNSVSSVLYQLLRAGQLARDEQGALSVAVDEYTPIKQVKRTPRVVVLDKAPEPKPRKIVIVKRKRDEGQGIAALKADSGETNLPRVEKFDMGAFKHHEPVFKAFHPSAIVDNLSVLHARELYDYLRKIFGGV